jgi:hypothetical protein
MLKHIVNWLRQNFLQTAIYSKRKTEMIEIKILNPHEANKFVLRETAKYLLSLAGDQMVAEHEMPQLPPAAPNCQMVAQIPVAPTEVPLAPSVMMDGVSQESYIPEIPMPPSIPSITSVASDDSEAPAQVAYGTHQSFGNKELDVNGLPWDNRIHARTKTKTAEGAWKLMRGVNLDLVKQVEIQLRGALNAPSAPVNVPIPPAATDTNSAWFTAMARITAVVKDGQMTHAQVMTIVKSMGLESIPLIAQRPDLIPSILHRIDHFVQHGQFLN